MSNVKKTDKFPIEQVGRLEEISFRTSAEEHITSEWKDVKKIQAGDQFCLIAEDSEGNELFLSICRVGEIPEVKKLVAEIDIKDAKIHELNKECLKLKDEIEQIYRDQAGASS